MNYNVDFEIASAVFLLVIGLYVIVHYGLEKRSHRLYVELVGMCFLTDVADVVCALTTNHFRDFPMWMNYAFNTFYFVLSVGLGLFFLFYFMAIIVESGNARRFHFFAFLPLLIYIGMLFTTPYTRLIYYFDNELGYQHGTLYGLVYFMPFAYVIATAILIIVHRKVVGGKRLFATMMYLLISLVGALTQALLLPNCLLSVFGASVGVVLIAFTMEYDELEKIMERADRFKADKEKADRAREESEKISREKDRFFARMTNEIKTPISSILGMNELIEKEANQDSIKNYTSNIESTGKFLLTMVGDIMDYSSMAEGNIEIHPSGYYIKNLLNDCYMMIAPAAREKGITFDIEVESTLYNSLYGDEIRIRQMIINLLNNAIKYTSKGRVCLAVSGEETEEAYMLRLAVRDTGVGLDPEDKANILADFKKIEEKSKEPIVHAGLGLAITKQLTVLMNGRLMLESVRDLGSSFTIVIPQIVMDETPIGEVGYGENKKLTQSVARKALVSAPNAKVLVVDDVSTNLRVMGGLLKASEVQVFTASSGEECLDMVEKQVFDLIFLDHMMPGMDGLDTMYEMKHREENLNKTTPVIMLTGNTGAELQREYMEEGFAGYVAKPCKARDLEEKLAEFLPNDLILSRQLDI